MHTSDDNTVHLSVRELVEFVLRSGDIDNRRTGPAVMDAMMMGANVHRLIQKQQDASYTAEVPFRISVDMQEAVLDVSGRADGVIEAVEHTSLPVFSVQWHPERMCLERSREDTVDGSKVIERFLAVCGENR